MEAADAEVEGCASSADRQHIRFDVDYLRTYFGYAGTTDLVLSTKKFGNALSRYLRDPSSLLAAPLAQRRRALRKMKERAQELEIELKKKKTARTTAATATMTGKKRGHKRGGRHQSRIDASSHAAADVAVAQAEMPIPTPPADVSSPTSTAKLTSSQSPPPLHTSSATDAVSLPKQHPAVPTSPSLPAPSSSRDQPASSESTSVSPILPLVSTSHDTAMPQLESAAATATAMDVDAANASSQHLSPSPSIPTRLTDTDMMITDTILSIHTHFNDTNEPSSLSWIAPAVVSVPCDKSIPSSTLDTSDSITVPACVPSVTCTDETVADIVTGSKLNSPDPTVSSSFASLDAHTRANNRVSLEDHNIRTDLFLDPRARTFVLVAFASGRIDAGEELKGYIHLPEFESRDHRDLFIAARINHWHHRNVTLLEKVLTKYHIPIDIHTEEDDQTPRQEEDTKATVELCDEPA